MTTYDCCACGGAEGEQPCLFCYAEVVKRDARAIAEQIFLTPPPLTNTEKVGEFHRAFGVDEPGTPTTPAEEVLHLRATLISEEADEVDEALANLSVGDGSLADLAKELADLLVVTYGTARAFGIDIDAVFEEVHRSNMSKLGEDGRPIYREDGKVLKGPNYSPADVQSVLDRQSA